MAAHLSPIVEEPTIAFPMCKMCHEIPTKPKQIPCGDTFCSDCLRSYISKRKENGEFPCPVCGVKMVVPEDGKKSTKANIVADISKKTDISRSNGQLSKGDSFNSPKPCALKPNNLDLTQAKLSQTCFASLHSSYLEYQKSVKTLTNDADGYLQNLKDACNSTKRSIVHKAEQMHRDIDLQKNLLLQEVDSKKELQENDIQKTILVLKKSEIKLMETTSFLENVILFTGKASIPSAASISSAASTPSVAGIPSVASIPSIARNQTEINETKKQYKNSHHSPTDVPKRAIEHRNSLLLGKLHKGHSKTEEGPTTKLKVDKSFRVDESLTSLVSTIDDTLAVISYSTKKCVIYTLTGDCVQDVTKALVQPITVASLTNGKLLIADKGNESHTIALRMYYTDGEVFHSNLNILDAPWGVTETSDDNLVICHPDKQKVCLYDRKGRLKVNLKSSGSLKLFSNPRCVCVNVNGDIIVSDFGHHAVLFFDKDGKYKFSYGSEGRGPGRLMHPCGVCTDWNGNLVIADSDNNLIHLVSPDGKFLRFLSARKDTLEEPVAVCFTKDGQLVVGEWGGRIIILNYIRR